jgi:superfamily II DNA or RNA helicase
VQNWITKGDYVSKYKLRPYQQELFENIRTALTKYRAVSAEAPTGAGKSIIMAAIIDSFLAKNRKRKQDRHIYFLVDERFLLFQFSEHLNNMGISHDLITSGQKEGRPVHVHIATIQSLRKHRPKNKPTLFMVDEDHFSCSPSYMDIFYEYPESKVLGFSASQETGSGKGLAHDYQYDENGILIKNEDGTPLNLGNGIFDVMVECPVSKLELTEGIELTDESGVTTIETYLVPVKYYAVPIKGIEGLHIQAGDYKTDEVEKLLKDRGTYGNSVKEMQKETHIQSHVMFFQKSVKSCYEMETILHSHGETAEVLEGSLTKKQRKDMMSRFNKGTTKNLITCKMVLKGVDIPKLLLVIDNAPTPSRGTLTQKIGRGLRKAEGKTEFIYKDMVANFRCLPNFDPYAKIDWNFNSKKYNKKPNVGSGEEQVCSLCYALLKIGSLICPECGAEKKIVPKKEKPQKHLDGDLVLLKPIPLKDRSQEDKTAVNKSISKAIVDNDIEALKEIGKTLTSGRNLPFWIYHKMKETTTVIDVTLLFRIQRSFDFKRGWEHYAKKQIRLS